VPRWRAVCAADPRDGKPPAEPVPASWWRHFSAGARSNSHIIHRARRGAVHLP
jgi:hypothetical protein